MWNSYGNLGQLLNTSGEKQKEKWMRGKKNPSETLKVRNHSYGGDVSCEMWNDEKVIRVNENSLFADIFMRQMMM